MSAEPFKYPYPIDRVIRSSCRAAHLFTPVKELRSIRATTIIAGGHHEKAKALDEMICECDHHGVDKLADCPA